MTTELKIFKEAYPSMTIAVYEPLILRWVSQTTVWLVVDHMVRRAVPTKQAQMARMSLINRPSLREKRLPADFGQYMADQGIDLNKMARNPDWFLNSEMLAVCR